MEHFLFKDPKVFVLFHYRFRKRGELVLRTSHVYLYTFLARELCFTEVIMKRCLFDSQKVNMMVTAHARKNKYLYLQLNEEILTNLYKNNMSPD